ncbi:hypothetical protein GIB67_027748, partial [Kingdonia uniflora]
AVMVGRVTRPSPGLWSPLPSLRRSFPGTQNLRGQTSVVEVESDISNWGKYGDVFSSVSCMLMKSRVRLKPEGFKAKLFDFALGTGESFADRITGYCPFYGAGVYMDALAGVCNVVTYKATPLTVALGYTPNWLSYTNVQSRSSFGTSSGSGYFGCGGSSYWIRDCPWKESKCEVQGCVGTRMLLTSRQDHSYGKKYLKYFTCGYFQWLKATLEDFREGKNIKHNVKVTVEMGLDEFIKKFKIKTTM